MSKKPLVICVILNYNGANDTRQCVRSLQASEYDNLGIVLVDNCSTDDSVSVLKAEFPNIPLIVTQKNGGYSYGNNVGIRYALEQGAEYVLISNNDTLYPASSITAYVESFAKNKNIGIVSPKALYSEKPELIYCGGGKIDFLKCSGAAMYQGRESKTFALTEREIDMAEGCSLMVRSEVFNNLGLLDEQYFMYFEDLEFSLRISKLYIIWFNPKVMVYHKSGAGKGWSNHSPLYNYYYTRNRFIVFNSRSGFYCIYVFLFSVFVVVAKTLVITLADRKSKSYALTSLWRGLVDGTNSMIKKKIYG